MQLPAIVVSVFAGWFGGAKGGEPLHEAARTGNIVHAHLALMRFPNAVNAPQRIGKGYYPSPVHLAADRNHVGVLQFLIARGGDVNEPGKGCAAPLQMAAQRGSYDTAGLLLKHGAALDIFSAVALDKWDEVQRCFHLARAFGLHTPMANAATRAGFGKKPLLNWAVDGGHLRMAELLIRNGADVNPCESPSKWYECPPLHAALGAKRLDMAALLLKHGAKIDAQDCDGYTALHIAVLDKNVAAARFLLQHKAGTEISQDSHAPRISDINGDQRTFFTPLHTAAKHESPELVALLLAHGADPNARAAVPRPSGIYTREDEQELAKPTVRAARGATPLTVAAAIEPEWDRDARKYKPIELRSGRALCVLLLYQAGGR